MDMLAACVTYPVLVTGLLSAPVIEASNPADPVIYIELLWSKPTEGALARQETRSFVLEPGFDHRVCVAVLGPKDIDVTGLVLQGVDPQGQIASTQPDPGFDGTKRCYPAMLPADGAPGTWSYHVLLGGESSASADKPVEVARTLAEAPFYQPSSTPYVLGRPNYDDSIAPEAYTGRLVWVMHVDAAGKVVDVDIETSEGIGEQMKPRALAAGYLSLFPPDPSRGTQGIQVRRTLNFAPD